MDREDLIMQKLVCCCDDVLETRAELLQVRAVGSLGIFLQGLIACRMSGLCLRVSRRSSRLVLHGSVFSDAGSRCCGLSEGLGELREGQSFLWWLRVSMTSYRSGLEIA